MYVYMCKNVTPSRPIPYTLSLTSISTAAR